MDFDNEHLSIAEYSHTGLSRAINEGDFDVFAISVSHLPGPEARKLLDRFEFLASMRVRCHSVKGHHVELGYQLFKEHVGRDGAKGDFRNSLNDMLICPSRSMRPPAVVSSKPVTSCSLRLQAATSTSTSSAGP
jgi:hypothetical protein